MGYSTKVESNFGLNAKQLISLKAYTQFRALVREIVTTFCFILVIMYNTSLKTVEHFQYIGKSNTYSVV